MREFIKKDMPPEYFRTVALCINPNDSGGESINLELDLYDNGDEENNIFTNLHIVAHCYGTHSTRMTLWTGGVHNLTRGLNELACYLDDQSKLIKGEICLQVQ